MGFRVIGFSEGGEYAEELQMQGGGYKIGDDYDARFEKDSKRERIWTMSVKMGGECYEIEGFGY
jgi:hypothetical protein